MLVSRGDDWRKHFFKVQFGPITRRLKYEYVPGRLDPLSDEYEAGKWSPDATVDVLNKRISDLFKLPSIGYQLLVTYRDRETDMVTISDDDDVEDAMRLLLGGSVCLHVTTQRAQNESHEIENLRKQLTSSFQEMSLNDLKGAVIAGATETHKESEKIENRRNQPVLSLRELLVNDLKDAFLRLFEENQEKAICLWLAMAEYEAQKKG